jgi:hypothetical protein
VRNTFALQLFERLSRMKMTAFERQKATRIARIGIVTHAQELQILAF